MALGLNIALWRLRGWPIADWLLVAALFGPPGCSIGYFAFEVIRAKQLSAQNCFRIAQMILGFTLAFNIAMLFLYGIRINGWWLPTYFAVIYGDIIYNNLWPITFRKELRALGYGEIGYRAAGRFRHYPVRLLKRLPPRDEAVLTHLAGETEEQKLRAVLEILGEQDAQAPARD